MARHSATWKTVERRVAAKLHGVRVGPVGVAGPDVLTSAFAVQVKHRRALPTWLTAALSGIREQAGASGRTGLVVLHEERRRDSVVVLALSDFIELLEAG